MSATAAPDASARVIVGAATSPRLLLAVGGGYALLLGWLALHTRVYIDEIWLIEWGRIMLDPGSDHSMYMFADGSSLRLPVRGGPVLADWLFRTFGSVAGFRLVNVAAMLVLALAARGLALAHGVRADLAGLLAIALLFDPTMAQSVVLGRPDALALAVVIGGLWLADRGARRILRQAGGWLQMVVGYSLCVCAISIWVSAMLVGPLIFAHWLACGVRARRAGHPRWRVAAALLLVPLAVLVATVDLPHAWAVRQVHAADPIFPTWTATTELRRVPELVAISCFLVLPGVLAIPLLRPRWLIGVFALAYVPIFLSGFYTFRIPYLLMYAVAALVLVMARANSSRILLAWRRLLLAAIAIALVLLGVRALFGLANEPRPLPQDGFVARLPAGALVADFSWDFYEAGRLGGQRMTRSYPAMEGARVLRWLAQTRPDVVIRAVDSLGTWVLVEDLDAKLRASGYCESAWVDHEGREWPRDRLVRPVPSPLLWRLGLYRDPGPYSIWVPCPVE
jgi:hypothetical protein